MQLGKTQNCRIRIGKDQRGFSYLVMLFATAIFAVGLGVIVPWASTLIRQEREEALIDNANTLVRAIRSYAAIPVANGMSRYPSSLQDLVEDRRGGVLRRHLRSLQWDPLGRTYDWGLVRDKDGGITGVYSISIMVPQRAVLPTGATGTLPSQHYADWLFMASSGAALRNGSASVFG